MQHRFISLSKVTAIAWSALLALLILAFGQGVWGLLLFGNLRMNPALPWAPVAMAPILWAMWQYLGGRWRPQSTSEVRRRYLRATPASAKTYMWTFVAGALSVVALAGYWIVLFSFVKMRANALPDLSKYPLVTIVLTGVMASLVSPLTEEAAFRGYCQGVLGRAFPGITAVLISSVLFALAHLTQGFFWPKLLVYFLAGVVFGVPAYLTKSILPTIPVHITADLTFFALVWPHDAARHLLKERGPDPWLYIHAAQAVIFTALAALAFRRLAQVTAESRTVQSDSVAECA